MTIKLKLWNIQDHLKTQEDRQAYLGAALEEAGDDTLYMNHVFDDIAESLGITKLSQEPGLTRGEIKKPFRR